MQIYIFKNNEQFGPFDAAQIEEYIKTNIIDIIPEYLEGFGPTI